MCSDFKAHAAAIGIFCILGCDGDPVSSQPSGVPATRSTAKIVKFEGTVSWIAPIDSWHGSILAVDLLPQFVLVVELTDDSSPPVYRQGDRLCFGVHSVVLLFDHPIETVVDKSFSFEVARDPDSDRPRLRVLATDTQAATQPLDVSL
ncbi:MAG: hypothetical protein GXY55_09165 [Phycisphaerae bacterium]|nr:hypothetical protein [Phycisphaerae bacterium]